MLWVSKENISAAYRQSVCVFMLVLTICVEVYLWFALLLLAALVTILTTFLWWNVFELSAMQNRPGEDTLNIPLLAIQLSIRNYAISETILALLH